MWEYGTPDMPDMPDMLLHLKRQLVGTFKMFPTAFVCCLVLGLSGLTVARDNFKILMLDRRNLQTQGKPVILKYLCNIIYSCHKEPTTILKVLVIVI